MSHLQNLLAKLSGLQLKSEYWDVRVEDTFETIVTVKDGEVVDCTASPSLGAFLRVRKNGFWLYQSTTEVEKVREILLSLDQQTPPATTKNPYLPEKQKPFHAVQSGEQKFSAVPLEKKLKLVTGYDSQLRSSPLVVSTHLRYKDVYKVKSFANSVGTQFEFDFNQGGIRFFYTLKEGEQLFQDGDGFYGARFSDLQGQEEQLKKCLEESRLFLKAPAVQPGKYKVLLNPEVAGVFTHESFGHKSEADFMLGNSDALKEWKLGTKIGADCLTIVDEGIHKGTSGYCPVDDEGTPAQKNYLIKNGVLAGRLHSLSTAGQLDEKPTGNCRAMNFEWEPIVRMTSTYIEKGTEALDSLLRRSEGALLVEGVKHGSGLSTFTIAPSRGYRIGKNGVREPVRVTVISGSVFETLKNIEAVSSDYELHSSAVGGCGKMAQWPLPVADGGPYVLVKEMQVS